MVGKYYEELNVGDSFLTLGRTITETDIVEFLNLIRSLEPLFVDREYYERAGLFQGRLVPGGLIFALSLGLFTNLGLVDRTALAFLGMDEFRIPQPVFCGDTISAEIAVVDKKATSKSDRGVVTLRFAVTNQRRETVARWQQTLMFACRSAPVQAQEPLHASGS